jgi:SAM-dependent methyltransferase
VPGTVDFPALERELAASRARSRLWQVDSPLARAYYATLRHASEHLAGKRVLDIGAGQAKYRKWFANAAYWAIDLPAWDAPNKGPHVFADAGALPFPDASIDGVLLLGVLEHVPHPDRVLADCARVLRPGGRVYFEIPFLRPVHHAPHDFRRWTPYGIRQALDAVGVELEVCRRGGGIFLTIADYLLTAGARLPSRLAQWLWYGTSRAWIPLLIRLDRHDAGELHTMFWFGHGTKRDRIASPTS